IGSYDTGQFLLAKREQARMYPASMTKIMTAYLAFEALESGRISLEDAVPVSEKAWRKGGSRMFLEPNTTASVRDVLRGVVVQSGNDASIAIAEFLGGSEEAFANLMNRKAVELGMESTHFTNSSGWPDQNHYTNALDLLRLADATIRHFPDSYQFYQEKEFTYNEIRQYNRNPLLQRNHLGTDGLKTGYTKASGYGLVASAEQNGQRFILILNGNKTSKERALEARELLAWAFANFNLQHFFDQETPIAAIPVWMGQQGMVAVEAAKPVRLSIARANEATVKVIAHHQRAVEAPITKGDVLGRVTVSAHGIDPVEVDLVASHDVARQNFFTRLLSKLTLLSSGGARNTEF
ncbi:MAG: D-alanyl-D-alanine carboxypeptidase family protein, partial [Pseudomonadota bacterium]